jgi:hypothetical protein
MTSAVAYQARRSRMMPVSPAASGSRLMRWTSVTPALAAILQAAYVTVMLRVVTDPPGTEVEVAHPCNW